MCLITYCYCYTASSRAVVQNRLFMSHMGSAVQIAYWTANRITAGVCSCILSERERIIAFIVDVVRIRHIMR